MTKTQKNWLISLLAITLVGGATLGVALPLTMCSQEDKVESIELKWIGNFNPDINNPKVYIRKDQNKDDANVLRFMEIEANTFSENIYGCTGWTVFGTKIESSNIESVCFNANIDLNTIPQIVSIDNVDYNIKNIGDFRGDSILSVTISNFVENIGYKAFNGCTDIISLDLTNATSLQIINEYAFSDCSGLIGPLTIPASVIQIDDNAFNNCLNLISLDLSDAINLTTIGANAFNGCSNLAKTLTIVSNVTSIGDSAFIGTDFSEVNFLQMNPLKLIKSENIFAKSDTNKNDKIIIYVPKADLNLWKTPEIVASLGIASVDQIQTK